MYDILLPYDGEYFDDAGTDACDWTSAAVSFVWRIFFALVHDACRLACVYALSGKSARKQLQLKFDRKFGLFSSFWKFGRFLKGTFLKRGSFFWGRKRVDLEWNFEFSFWKRVSI